MKIYSISTVKNEEDIIETFVRYHLNIFDKMIIIDNNSSDKTYDILNNLVDEGLNIEVFYTDKFSVHNEIENSKLLDIIINKSNCDLIIPIDCDEFLVSKNKQINPRFYLEQIKEDVHIIRSYIYIPNKDSNEFNLDNFSYRIRNPINRYNKIILPSKKIRESNFNINKCANTIYNKNYKGIKKVINTHLYYAHFSLRSVQQLKSKILINSLAIFCNKNRDKAIVTKWLDIYHSIKGHDDITLNNLLNIANYLVIGEFGKDIDTVYDPLDLNFCNKFKITYNKRGDFLLNLLGFCEDMTKEIVKLEKERE